MKRDFLPLFESARRNRGENLAKGIFAFAVIDEIHTIADKIEAVFRFCLDVLPMCCCDALQCDEVQRQRRIFGMSRTRLKMCFPSGNGENRRCVRFPPNAWNRCPKDAKEKTACICARLTCKQRRIDQADLFAKSAICFSGSFQFRCACPCDKCPASIRSSHELRAPSAASNASLLVSRPRINFFERNRMPGGNDFSRRSHCEFQMFKLPSS